MEASSGLMLEFLRCCLSVSGSVKAAVQQEWPKKGKKKVWSQSGILEIKKYLIKPDWKWDGTVQNASHADYRGRVSVLGQRGETHAPGKKYKKNRVIASPVPPLGVFIHPTSIHPIIFPSSLSRSFLTHCWHTGLMQGVSRLCFKCFFHVMELFRCFVFKTIPYTGTAKYVARAVDHTLPEGDKWLFQYSVFFSIFLTVTVLNSIFSFSYTAKRTLT